MLDIWPNISIKSGMKVQFEKRTIADCALGDWAGRRKTHGSASQSNVGDLHYERGIRYYIDKLKTDPDNFFLLWCRKIRDTYKFPKRHQFQLLMSWPSLCFDLLEW